MQTADQRQIGLQQWLKEYEELYNSFLIPVANPALLLTRLRAYLEEQLPTSSNPKNDVGPRDGSGYMVYGKKYMVKTGICV
jgi:hypothetical protein